MQLFIASLSVLFMWSGFAAVVAINGGLDSTALSVAFISVSVASVAIVKAILKSFKRS